VTFLCLVLVVVVAYVDRLQTDMSTRNVYLVRCGEHRLQDIHPSRSNKVVMLMKDPVLKLA
jgi:hypothetical protein